MSKTIFIGDCPMRLTRTDDLRPAHTPHLPNFTAAPSSPLPLAAMTLASAGIPTVYCGETGLDPLGQLVLQAMKESGVDISCIDRYSDGGLTSLDIVCSSSSPTTHYRIKPAQPFSTRWPQISGVDTVVFGTQFALDDRATNEITDLLTLSHDVKARIIYLPGYSRSLAPSVTRLMPRILDYMELSHMVIVTPRHLNMLFGLSDPERAYTDKVSFHTPLMLYVDPDASSTQQTDIQLYAPSGRYTTRLTQSEHLLPQAIAAAAKAVSLAGVNPDNAALIASHL